MELTTPTLIPWYETIPCGATAVAGGVYMAALKRFLYYTTPQPEPVILFGLTATFDERATREITVQLCDSKLPDVWTPFYKSPDYAVFGGASPAFGGWDTVMLVLPLPEPYVIQPGHRIQILLEPNAAAILTNPDYITLVGVRDLRGRGGAPCFS